MYNSRLYELVLILVTLMLYIAPSILVPVLLVNACGVLNR